MFGCGCGYELWVWLWVWVWVWLWVWVWVWMWDGLHGLTAQRARQLNRLDDSTGLTGSTA
jgi:hypothetical protein